MTSKLTRERIELIANFHRAMTLPPSHAEIEELARMALAAMDSEPVAYTDERNLGYIDRGRETAYLWGKQNSEASDVALYRHAQPVPVVPGEITSASAPEVFEIAAEAERLGLRGTYASYAVGWNACRAAMLSGGKS